MESHYSAVVVVCCAVDKTQLHLPLVAVATATAACRHKTTAAGQESRHQLLDDCQQRLGVILATSTEHYCSKGTENIRLGSIRAQGEPLMVTYILIFFS